MEQATAGKAPPPIAINSGGGIQLINMNAVRAAAVGATVVPSPGSAQNATVVGSPGPPGKAVGPRMLHITPQMLAAANARPGAPGEESDIEKVKSCDDELKFEQTCVVRAASNTGVSSDLLSCDNDVECEEGEIRDSDEDSSHQRINHSTSDDHQASLDNHILITSENDLSENAGEKSVVTGLGSSSVDLNERSDHPSLKFLSSACNNRPSPPPEPDPKNSPNDFSNKMNSSDSEGNKKVLEKKMEGERCSESVSSLEGAQQRLNPSLESPGRLVSTSTCEEEVVVLETDGAHDEIKVVKSCSVEDRQNNNSNSPPSEEVPTRVPVPNQGKDEASKPEEKSENESAHEVLHPRPSTIVPLNQNQPCVQVQQGDTNKCNTLSKDSDTPVGANNCDIVEESGESNHNSSSEIQTVTLSSDLEEENRMDVQEEREPSPGPVSSNKETEESSNVPPPPLISCDERESEILETERIRMFRRGDSTSSMDPVECVDDVNLDMFSEASQTSRNGALGMEKGHSPEPLGVHEIEIQREQRPVQEEDTHGFRETQDGKEKVGEAREDDDIQIIQENEDSRPKLMDMHLADYMLMDLDDDNGHRPWTTMQNPNPPRPSTIQKRSSVDQCSTTMESHQANSSSVVQLQNLQTPPSSSPSFANQVSAIKERESLNQFVQESCPQSSASCAFQMYTIGEAQGQRPVMSRPPNHDQMVNVSGSINHPRVAARIPQRADTHPPPPPPHHHQQHNSYPYPDPNARQVRMNMNNYPTTIENLMTQEQRGSTASNPTFPSHNRANVISNANSAFSPVTQSNQQQRVFTSDPQLLSQYMQYTKNSAITSVPCQTKSFTPAIVSSSTHQGKYPHEGTIPSYQPSTALQQQQHQHQNFPHHPNNQNQQQKHPTGGTHMQQNAYSQMQTFHQGASSSTGYHHQNHLQQQQHYRPSPGHTTSGNSSESTNKLSSPYQQRMTDYASSRYPVRFPENSHSHVPSSNPSRQMTPGNAYYQSQNTNTVITPSYHAQAHSRAATHRLQQQQQQQHRHLLQQQQSPPMSMQKEFSSCSYSNLPASAQQPHPHGGGVVGPRNMASTGYPNSSVMYQQQQHLQQRLVAHSGSLASSSRTPNYSGNVNYPGHTQEMSPRPVMPMSSSQVKSQPVMPTGHGNWNSGVPMQMAPRSNVPVPANIRQQYPYTNQQNQNLGRPQPHSQPGVEKAHFHQQSSMGMALSSPPSALSGPASHDQRRTTSVIAPPHRQYPSSGETSGGGGTSAYATGALPYRNISSSPGSRFQTSSNTIASPQTLRNPQFFAQHPHKNMSPYGAPMSDNSLTTPSVNQNQSVIRPNIYSGGIITTTVNTGSSYGQTVNSSNPRQGYGHGPYHNSAGGAGESSTNMNVNSVRNQASVICAPQSSSNREGNNSSSSYAGVGSNSSMASSSSASGSGYSGELTLQQFLSHPSAPFLCPPSLSSERSGCGSAPSGSGSGYFGSERVWESPYTTRGDESSDQDQYQYPLSSCQYSDAMRRYNAPITLQALSGLQPGANHLLVKTENGQLQLVSVRMQSPTAAAAAPGTPVVPSTVAAPPTSMSIAQQLPSNSPLPPPPHSSGSPLGPPISSSIITMTNIPPHPSQQGRIITSSSSNHIGTSWPSSNNNSLVNNNSTTSSPLPIITSTAAHPLPPPHLVPPLPQSSQPSPLPPSVIMPPNLSASNSQLLISTANNISSSTSSSTFSTAANAAVAAAQAAYNQHRAPHPVVVSSVPPPPPPVVGAQQTIPHPNSIPGAVNSLPPGASVIRTGILGSNLPPPPPIVVTSNSPAANNSTVTSSVVSSNSNLPPAAPASVRPQSNVSQVPNNNATNNAQSSGMRMMMTASNSMSMHPPQHHHNHPAYSQLHPPPLLPPSHQSPSSFASNNTSSLYASSNTTANSVSQMSNETAKNKCKNFLSFLLELSAKQNQTVARNVKNLIQGLIDGKVNEENFADRLQKEVNSQPQPCLVGFLKKSLPHLRHSLATSELKIEGIKPPPLSTLVPPAPVSALVPQTPPPPPTESRKKPSKSQPVRPSTPTAPSPVRILTPPVNSASPSSTPPTPVSASSSGSSAPPNAASSPSSSKSSKLKNASKSKSSAASGSTISGGGNASSSGASPSSKSSIPSLSKSGKEKEKKDKTFSSSGYSADDDINDVAAMGGVNLAEESQRILGSTEYVGTQIRSCRDETLIQASPIMAKYKVIAAKYGLEESPSPDVSALLSHAVEERLKTMIEKLSVIAEHRMDVIKLDERYEITQDVKGQLRFLEELDKIEKKRHDEQEREMLIRAAKSRSKSEDPEQAKLKAKAKEMQRVALEEMRQRDANLTALQAIGPRKKPKLDLSGGSHGSAVPSPLGATGASSSLGRTQMALRPRLKRVNLRDLLFLLEHDKETMRSPFLYKNLLLK